MDPLQFALLFCGGLALGALTIFLFLNRKISGLHREKNRLREEKLQLEATWQAESKAWQEKIQFLQQNKEEMSNQFKQLAETVLEDKGQKLHQQSNEKLSRLLDPLNQQLGQFRQQLEKTHTFRLQDSAKLHTQIEQLTKLNQQISQDALNLTNALKGQSQTQGAWGEMILEKVLEKSGLKKGEHYETQVSLNDEEYKRFRPDAILRLPGEKDVIVDAKVSLNGYEAYCSAQEGSAIKDEAAQAHIRSVRAHLKELEGKDYSSLPQLNSIDLVLMFIPVEGAFALALQLDSTLFQDAFEKRIVLVSPTTLFATLRTIENSWRSETQTKNAREIARKAGLLYDKFFGFIQDLEKVERSITQAAKACGDAKNKLSQGQGNLIRKAEELRDMGARTTKKIAKDLIN